MTLRSRPRGVSLAEALLTSFIMMMILAVVASLMHQYAEVTRHAAKKDASTEMRQQLDMIRRELMGAIDITDPPAGGTSTRLEFDRIDPASARGIPATLAPLPNPSPAVWDPRDPATTIQVTYERQVSGILTRQVGSGPLETVLSTCSFFQARGVGRTMFLTGSVQEDKIVKSYQVQLAVEEAVSWP